MCYNDIKTRRGEGVITKRFLAILTSVLVLFWLFACGNEAEKEKEPLSATESTGTESAQPAPDFTVYDGEGNAIKLSDFIGKPVVLNFWASWCGPCRNEMPYFEEAWGEFGNDVRFLMVNLDSNRTDAETFLEENSYSFTVYYDSIGAASNTYGVKYIPTTFFIDGAGNLVSYATGGISKEVLLKGINDITR